ncbi:hypothetical protein CAP36_14185 [Chitinophagaceae bacterium IBVUCB2]|nr:hypothetical protein CAP36_14185 [Chitinophagaceae bacterium IBVUCB2]
MSSYLLMLQADADDQYITESALAAINPSVTIKYVDNSEEMEQTIALNGEPLLILVNDQGTLKERGRTLRQLKTNDSYAHIPVVLLGERSSADYVKECYRAGASTFITKPSSVEATQKKIQQFLSYWLEVAEH